MFNVGDRVITPTLGVGTIIEITGEQSYLVTHDKTRPQLHRGNSINSDNYKEHSCWWYKEQAIREEISNE